MVTLAPGTTPPCGSVAVPSRLEVGSCAATATQRSATRLRPNAERIKPSLQSEFVETNNQERMRKISAYRTPEKYCSRLQLSISVSSWRDDVPNRHDLSRTFFEGCITTFEMS